MPSSVRIGPYTLGRTLGIGSFCKVKLAVHELTGQKVAIKILNRGKLKKMDMGAKVRTEIDIIKLFIHPHIIRLYEVIDTPTDIYSIMEYVPGGELFDYIVSKGRLDENEARRLFQEILSGVEYCHTHMVVHRDLKPENLLLDQNHHIKLADFGLSNRLRDGFFLKTSCGSPNYAAPEVISGMLYSGPEVDVWSCGVILYAILCGSLPFDDENIRSLFRKIKGGIYTIPSYVSESARDLVAGMLVVDPQKRITIPQIRGHQWFQTNLPQYLALSAEQQIVRTQLVDQPTMARVTDMGFNRDKCLGALAMGHELLTSKRLAHLVQARQMAVVYNLLLDQRRRKEQDIQNLKQSLADVQRLATRAKQRVGGGGRGGGGGGGGRDVERAKLSTSMDTSKDCTSSRRKRLAWGMGREVTGKPQDVMNRLYSCLQRANFEWKVFSLYRVKARYPAGLTVAGRGGSRRVHGSEVIKVQFCMYRARSGVFMVDVQKLYPYGQTFHFLDIVGNLFADFSRHFLPVPPPGMEVG